MTNPHSETVLITGASSGIGLELAREFAKHGHPLVITSTTESDLQGVAEEFSTKYGVTVRFVAQNLLQPEAAKLLFDALTAQNITVDILVNNAGVGHRGKFVEVELHEDVEIIRLNIEALVGLTKYFLPGMISRGWGRILNTASIAGFMPAPTMAVYHASKAFVLSFSEALAAELKDTGVTLTALCPGATDTDFFPRADAVESTMFQKGNVMAPQDVAEGAYQALMAGDRVYVAGGLNKVIVFMRRLAPDSLLTKMSEKFYAESDEHKRDPGEVAAKAAAR